MRPIRAPSHRTGATCCAPTGGDEHGALPAASGTENQEERAKMLLDEDRPPVDWLPEPPRDNRPWPLSRLPPSRARRIALLIIAIMIVTSGMLVAGVRVARQDAGHVGVVRNGGPLDDRGIRQILGPGSKLTWTGMFSQPPHEYPASKVVLFYTITSDARRGDRREVDVVTVPTQDGVQVGLEGTVFFKFVGEKDMSLLRRFDQTFGTRKFPLPGTKDTVYPWKGDDGFAALLDATFRPILDNDLRSEVGRFACAELVASCSMVRRVVSARLDARNTNTNIAAIEARLDASLRADLLRTFGGDYFRDVHVRISRVTLPGNVQTAVDNVQAQYVAVNGAKAQVRRAEFDAKRNLTLADSYNKSPALARIEEIRAAPKGSTIVLSSGTSKQPGINVGN
jgi:regulator of protease activity HflC (stomatin/prohibitin superfamily)